MADIFISYARADRPGVEKLASTLDAAGFSVWWDRLIDGGSEYSADIEAELNAAKVVIVAWSGASRNSRWVKDEASAAADAGKLIPITLDGDLAPIGFRQFQAIDFKNWNGRTDAEMLIDLLRIVSARISGKASEPPPNISSAPNSIFSKRNFLVSGIALGAVLIALVLALNWRPAEGGRDAAAIEQAEMFADAAGIIDDKSIAVLPFANLSAKPEDGFFALGIHDQVLTQLSKIADVRVISRTSVMGYRETAKQIPEIALELGVAMILEGTVNRSGDRVRINVKLFDAKKERLVWEDSSDNALSADNLFEIQNKITRNIADRLGAAITGAEKTAISEKPTSNIEAYSAFLKGKSKGRYADNTEKDFAEAISEFDKAILLDPFFAAAYAEKANAHLALYWSGANRAANLVEARAALDRAFELAPESIDTLTALGIFYYRVLFDYDRAEDYLSKAVKLAPGNTIAWGYLGAVLRRSGRVDEAVAPFKKANTLSPLRPGQAAEVVYTLGLAGRIDEALEIADRAREINPDAPYLIGASVSVAVLGNDVDRAWRGAGDFGFIDSGAYDFFRSQMTLYLRDEEKIRALISNWPPPREDAPFLNYFDLMRVIAQYRLGEMTEAQPLLDQLQTRLEAALADDLDHDENRKIIIAVYALQKDIEKMRVAHRAMMENPPKDRMWLFEEGFVVVIAHALAGEHETALALIEQLMNLASPAQFARVEASPFFDDYRDLTNYRVLKQRYDDWRN